MSNTNTHEPDQGMEHGGLTEEELQALEEERKAAYEAELAPYKALKERLQKNTTELTDLQMALVDVYEQILTP